MDIKSIRGIKPPKYLTKPGTFIFRIFFFFFFGFFLSLLDQKVGLITLKLLY
jgi:hypothetical protein